MQEFHATGIMRQLELQYMPLQTVQNYQQTTVISLKHVQGIYLMAVSGLILATCVLMVEIMHDKVTGMGQI